MGNICMKGSRAPAEIQKDPRRPQSGSRVYIRTQDPSVDLQLKVVHLPQDIYVNTGEAYRGPAGTSVPPAGAPAAAAGMSRLDEAQAPRRPSRPESALVYTPQSYAGAADQPGTTERNLLPEPGAHQEAPHDHQAQLFGFGRGEEDRFQGPGGPRTDDVIVDLLNMGITSVPPTQGNDYLYKPDTHPAEFDAINVLAITQIIVNMYRRSLQEIGERQPWEWMWGRRPITVLPYAFRLPKAYYSRVSSGLQPGVIRYGLFERNGKMTFYGRSFDTVAHETGWWSRIFFLIAQNSLSVIVLGSTPEIFNRHGISFVWLQSELT